ncbi:hypothetical protein [Rubritalea tangerina]
MEDVFNPVLEDFQTWHEYHPDKDAEPYIAVVSELIEAHLSTIKEGNADG